MNTQHEAALSLALHHDHNSETLRINKNKNY
jgi:hypothetical protein